MEQSKKNVVGYLPDETPPPAKLIVFALQQILVMFPATVLVAILTRFDIATTIFASGFATICFLLITKRQIPLYYGSSFAYIAAITGLMASQQALGVSEVDSIRMAQFGIMMSGLVSIGIGLIIKRSGQRFIERVLPPTITGPIALVIAMSLAKNALDNAAGGGQLLAALGARDMTGIEGFADLGALSNYVSANWAVALIRAGGDHPLLGLSEGNAEPAADSLWHSGRLCRRHGGDPRDALEADRLRRHRERKLHRGAALHAAVAEHGGRRRDHADRPGHGAGVHRASVPA